MVCGETNSRKETQIKRKGANRWMAKREYSKIISLARNTDTCLAPTKRLCLFLLMTRCLAVRTCHETLLWRCSNRHTRNLARLQGTFLLEAMELFMGTQITFGHWSPWDAPLESSSSPLMRKQIFQFFKDHLIKQSGGQGKMNGSLVTLHWRLY